MLNKGKGFTLIEMLVVVALISILAAIALPAYNGYVNRSKIKTAQADVVALSLNLENFYQRNMKYPATSALDTQAKVENAFTGWKPASQDFVFTVTGSAATYTVVATGSTSGVSGCVVSLTHTGSRTISPATCPYYNGGKWL